MYASAPIGEGPRPLGNISRVMGNHEPPEAPRPPSRPWPRLEKQKPPSQILCKGSCPAPVGLHAVLAWVSHFNEILTEIE